VPHVCFVYDTPADFVGGARVFLAEGLRAGERVCLVGPPVDDLGLDGVERASVDQIYPPGPVIEPSAQVAAYAARTAEALADGYTGCSAALAGELDLAGHALFPEALERADPLPVDGALVFDAAGLRFVDHQALLALAAHAGRRGLVAVLRDAPPVAARLVGLMGVDTVRVEVAA
jgi:anti-anti-sigma regulatory factor